MPLFSELPLIRPILNAVEAQGYKEPTPIQAEAIPHLLEGRDLLGVAQTGTGKTAAFTLPVLNRVAELDGRPAPGTVRVLILAPTRELASQINDSIRDYASNLRIRRTAIFGGAPMGPQIKALRGGVDTLVATPGRLMDLMKQGHVNLEQVCMFVLDEADRMLDMGFIHDVTKINAAMSGKQQTVLFSATMPKAVQKFAQSLLKDPVKVEVAPASSTAEKVAQKVHFVPKDKKRSLLLNVLKQEENLDRALVFTRTKHGADWLAKHLQKAGHKAAAIHGDKRQFERKRTLNDFKSGRINLLIATDIAARGIDVDGVTHVFNYELPMDPESYVHRIGRTGRGGAEGLAIAFCDQEEVSGLRQIERLIRQSIEVDEDHEWHIDLSKAGFKSSGPKKRFGGGRPGGRSNGKANGKPGGRGNVKGRNANASEKGKPHQGPKGPRNHTPNKNGKAAGPKKHAAHKRPANQSAHPKKEAA